MTLPPTPYARQGGEVIAAQLAKIGIRAKLQNVEWAQWLSGTYTLKNYDLTLISHVEPFDLGNFAKPDYYWGYGVRPVQRAVRQDQERLAPRRPLAPAGRCAAPAGPGFAFTPSSTTPQWVTVANKNLRGLWKDMPIFVNDLSALSWAT